MSQPYDALMNHWRSRTRLASAAGILVWDQETQMPPGALEARGRQLAELSSVIHDMTLDPRLDDWLAACEADPDLTDDPTAPPAVNLREIRRTVDRKRRLPAALVRERAELTSAARHHWAQARRQRRFDAFMPWLQKLVDLARRTADCLGWADGGEPWDALADDFEPGLTAADVQRLFEPIKDQLAPLIQQLAHAPHQPTNLLRGRLAPLDQQRRLVRDIAADLGFDFQRGRLDVSTHPFCGGALPHDVRMTTRFDEHNLMDALSSTIHETGHALYNQGLPPEHADLPMGAPVSLAIHESQSRLWQVHVGQSHAFWRWLSPRLADALGWDDLDPDAMYQAANIVQPDFIRVDADEATYNFHILLRFELERDMIAGNLDVADLPDAWNQKMDQYLGLTVPDDAMGCLQDIHWSKAAFGYFPTYTIGNLYAAQLFDQARRDLGPDTLDAHIERGEFQPLHHWLAHNVYRHGMRYPSDDLCQHITGQPLNPQPMIDHQRQKLTTLYRLA